MFWTIALAVVASTAFTVLVAGLLVRNAVRDRVVANLHAQARAAAGVLDRPVGGTVLQEGLYEFFRAQDEFLGLPGEAMPGTSIRDALLQAAGSDGSGEATAGGLHVVFVTEDSRRGEFVLARRAGLGVDDWRPFFWWLVVAGVVGAGAAAAGAYVVSRRMTGPLREVAAASSEVSAGRLSARVPVRSDDELGELAASFNSMADQLGAARDAERTFLLSVSHELKTPLTAIRGYAEALKEGAVPPDEAAIVLQAESERLERLVRDLLDLARLDRREFSVARERVDLGRVAREAGQRHAAAAERFGVRLSVDAVAGARALADHDRLLQVASNLTENALRVTPVGGVVGIRARPGSLSVTDTGPGLAPEDVPRAFERFYLYAKYGGERPVGSGLGLAIAEQLVRAMGGRVEVHTAPGQGTTFVVNLTLAPDDAPAPPPRPDPAPLEGWFEEELPTAEPPVGRPPSGEPPDRGERPADQPVGEPPPRLERPSSGGHPAPRDERPTEPL